MKKSPSFSVEMNCPLPCSKTIASLSWTDCYWSLALPPVSCWLLMFGSLRLPEFRHCLLGWKIQLLWSLRIPLLILLLLLLRLPLRWMIAAWTEKCWLFWCSMIAGLVWKHSCLLFSCSLWLLSLQPLHRWYSRLGSICFCMSFCRFPCCIRLRLDLPV